jgi:tryptophan synthase alpha chain
MSAIDELFKRLKSANEKAFMPFITAGDPNLELTEQLILELDKTGCHLVEIGIPYSDPIADGPVIQASYTRALNHGTRLNEVFEMLKRVTPRIKMPVVTMVSYAIIFRIGIDQYLQRAKEVGVSGAIVPDMPVDESETLAAKCREQDFSLIQLITPTTPRERAVEIAEQTTGFIYYVSVTGITGERNELPTDLVSKLQWLRRRTDLPICVGFGISQPSHVQLLGPVSDGLIVGSAIVRRIAAATDESVPEPAVISDVTTFAQSMIGAMKSIPDR